MSAVVLIYGDEPQLIEEKKIESIRRYESLPITQLDSELGANRISEKLCEDSLFGDTSILLLVNPPIIRKANKKITSEWEAVIDKLLAYTGDSPVIIVYHDLVDKRIKANTELLKTFESYECKRLNAQELKSWIYTYCKEHGYSLQQDALAYLGELLELWQDVPASFMRTEFDRYFLQLGNEKKITRSFLEENSSDYGAKNIFMFKDALIKKDAATMLALFPFMLNYKEIDRAMSYIEGQLRLQLMVNECQSVGMSENQIVELCKNKGSSYKAYPIKLAYRESKHISTKALRELIRSLYLIVAANRKGEGDMTSFRDLCLAYCNN